MAYGLTLATIEAAIVSWLSLDPSLAAVIKSDQQAPRPAYPYATYKLTTGPVLQGARATRDRTYNGGTDQIDITYRREGRLSLSVQFYDAADAWSALTLAQANLETYAGRDLLWAAGLGLVSIGEGRDLSFIPGSEWISRWGMDVQFSVGMNVIESVDTIESAEADVTITNEGGAELDPITLTVSSGA